MPHLLLLIALPFVFALIMFLASLLHSSKRMTKAVAIFLSFLPLVLLLANHGHWEGVSIKFPWISTLGIEFHLSVDGLSLLFIWLTALLIPLVTIMSKDEEFFSSTLFYAIVFLLQGVLFLLFSARDLVLFTIAWETMILPLYFIISLWGGSHRQAAAIKFLVYMIAGSCFFVAAVLGLYFTASNPSFNLDTLKQTAEQSSYAFIFLGIFLLAFAVKTPLFPFHAWLPEAYVQAPFTGTILLSALLSKAGIYGIARIGFELFPNMMSLYSPLLLILAIIGTLYGAITAWMQTDYKSLIAYSSFSHVNFILVGLFVISQMGLQGAILQAFNHGITIAALFLTAAWLKQRTGTTEIALLGGMVKFLPILSWFTFFFVLSSIALPGTNNFVGELMILLSLFKNNYWLAIVLTTSVILSAIYMLRYMQKIYLEAPKGHVLGTDIGIKELSLILPLTIIILGIGIYPAPLLDLLQPSTKSLLERDVRAAAITPKKINSANEHIIETHTRTSNFTVELT